MGAGLVIATRALRMRGQNTPMKKYKYNETQIIMFVPYPSTIAQNTITTPSLFVGPFL